MIILITVTSIFVLTWLTRVADSILPTRLCPICVGVSGTWIWMLAAQALGYSMDGTIIAILMGGSVVGAMGKIEKILSQSRFFLVWKTFFLAVGFSAVYSLYHQWWVAFALAVGLICLIVFLLFENRGGKESSKETMRELENKMKNCC